MDKLVSQLYGIATVVISYRRLTICCYLMQTTYYLIRMTQVPLLSHMKDLSSLWHLILTTNATSSVWVSTISPVTVSKGRLTNSSARHEFQCYLYFILMGCCHSYDLAKLYPYIALISHIASPPGPVHPIRPQPSCPTSENLGSSPARSQCCDHCWEWLQRLPGTMARWRW